MHNTLSREFGLGCKYNGNGLAKPLERNRRACRQRACVFLGTQSVSQGRASSRELGRLPLGLCPLLTVTRPGCCFREKQGGQEPGRCLEAVC